MSFPKFLMVALLSWWENINWNWISALPRTDIKCFTLDMLLILLYQETATPTPSSSVCTLKKKWELMKERTGSENYTLISILWLTFNPDLIWFLSGGKELNCSSGYQVMLMENKPLGENCRKMKNLWKWQHCNLRFGWVTEHCQIWDWAVCESQG